MRASPHQRCDPRRLRSMGTLDCPAARIAQTTYSLAPIRRYRRISTSQDAIQALLRRPKCLLFVMPMT